LRPTRRLSSRVRPSLSMAAGRRNNGFRVGREKKDSGGM
jgi:hypothetical protein